MQFNMHTEMQTACLQAFLSNVNLDPCIFMLVSKNEFQEIIIKDIATFCLYI